MAKVLISEKINPAGIELLKEKGHQVTQMETIGEAELAEKIKDAEALLVRILPITRELMESAPNLKIISKHGVGVDNIDLEAAKELGIAVTTTPDANGLSVAEHAMALLLSLAKNVVPVAKAYKDWGSSAAEKSEAA